MSFQFRLQKVLDYRLRLEKEQQQVLAREQAKALHLQEKRDSLLNQAQRHAGRVTDRTASTFSPQQVMAEIHYAEYLQQIADITEQQLVRQNGVVTEQREILLERTRERKLLSRLREKQNEQWQLNETRREQRLMDEVAARHHYRQSGVEYHKAVTMAEPWAGAQ